MLECVRFRRRSVQREQLQMDDTFETRTHRLKGSLPSFGGPGASARYYVQHHLYATLLYCRLAGAWRGVHFTFFYRVTAASYIQLINKY